MPPWLIYLDRNAARNGGREAALQQLFQSFCGGWALTPDHDQIVALCHGKQVGILRLAHMRLKCMANGWIDGNAVSSTNAASFTYVSQVYAS